MGNTLKVPGATLYYETRGSGPVLLFIGGGTSDTTNFELVGKHFEDRYTVVHYDRRGNGRSVLDGPPTAQVIEEHASDAIALLELLGNGEPADILGSSSGALIVLDVLARRPDLVRRGIPHEAPAFTLTPDREANLAFLRHALAEFERAGGEAGMAVFGNGSGTPEELLNGTPEEQETARRIDANVPFFFRYEMMSFVDYQPDLVALRTVNSSLVPAVGVDSVDTPPVQAIRILAKETDTEVAVFPGGHVGYLSDPEAFTAKLDEVLSA